MTLANHKGHRKSVNQSKVQVTTCRLQEGREKACEQDTIGIGFTSDWMKKWREFFFKSIM